METMEQLSRRNQLMQLEAEAKYRREMREWEEAQEQHRAELEEKVDHLRMTGQAEPRSLPEIFRMADARMGSESDADAIADFKAKSGTDYSVMSPDVQLGFDRANHGFDFYRRVRNDPKLRRKMERDLERREIETERWLFRNPPLV